MASAGAGARARERVRISRGKPIGRNSGIHGLVRKLEEERKNCLVQKRS